MDFLWVRLRVYGREYGLISLISGLLIAMFLFNDIVSIWFVHRILSECFSGGVRERVMSNLLSFSSLLFTEILLIITFILMILLIIGFLKRTGPGEEVSSERRRLFSLWFSDVVYLIKEPHFFLSYIVIAIFVLLIFNGTLLVIPVLSGSTSASGHVNVSQLVCPRKIMMPRAITSNGPSNSSITVNTSLAIPFREEPPSLSDNVQLISILVDIILGIGLPMILNQLLPIFFHSERELLIWHESRSIEEAINYLNEHIIVVGFGKLGEIATRLFLAWRPVSYRAFPVRYRIASEEKKGKGSPPWYLSPYLADLVVVDRELLGPYYKEVGEDFSIGIEDIDISFGEGEEFVGARGDLKKEIVRETLRAQKANLIINTSDDEETHRFLEEGAISWDTVNLITRVYNINWPGTSKKWIGMLKVDVNRDGIYYVLGRKMQYLISEEYMRELGRCLLEG